MHMISLCQNICEIAPMQKAEPIESSRDISSFCDDFKAGFHSPYLIVRAR